MTMTVQVIIGLLRAAMMKKLPESKSFLIDGFPRALDQAEMFEKMVKPPEMVLAFDCPEVSAGLCSKDCKVTGMQCTGHKRSTDRGMQEGSTGGDYSMLQPEPRTSKHRSQG